MKKFMNWVALFCVMMLLAGCSGVTQENKESTFVCTNLTEREELVEQIGNMDRGMVSFTHMIDFDFKEDIQGINLWQEVWLNGKCVDKELITCRDTSMETLGLRRDVETDDKYDIVSSQWHVLIVEPKVRIPLTPHIVDYIPERVPPTGFTTEIHVGANTYGGGAEITMEPDNTYVLISHEIDLTGKGTFGSSAAEGRQHEEFLQKNDAVIALRMDTYATLEEAQAAVEGMESTEERRNKPYEEQRAQRKAEAEAELQKAIDELKKQIEARKNELKK